MQFRYAARTASGERVRGSVVAGDRAAALAGLHGRALFVTSVERVRPWNVALDIAWPFGATPRRAQVAFFRCFATLIRAGVSLRRALQVTVERTTDAGVRAAVREVLADVERGEPVSRAFGRRPRLFSPVLTAMVAAGEAGGVLDDVLERIARWLEIDDRVRTSVAAALAYPATVALASLALLAFLIVRVVPMFADLFASFHVDLPPSTRLLLWLGASCAQPVGWIAAATLAGAATAAFLAVRGTRRGALLVDRLRFALPIAGPLMRTAVHARLARMLSTLVRSGVELTRALEVVTPVCGSASIEAALTHVGTALREGETFAQPLAAARVFDPMFVSLAAVGEETGMLDELLEKAADYFEADVAAAVATLGAVVEPVLIVGLGAVVGAIVSSVYVPLYSLIGSISR